MGFFWSGLPPYFVAWASPFLGKDVVAIETGTYLGDSAQFLADSFGTCVTIERSGHLAAQAMKRFSNDDRITVLEGSSRACLAEAIPDSAKPAFFWLDAHGMYDYEGPDDEENPLLEELRIILTKRTGSRTFIAIDDARGMGVQPEWPSVREIMALFQEHDYSAAIVDDCIVAVPAHLNSDFYGLYQLSRIWEVSALFHVWSGVKRLVSRRARRDRLVMRLSRR
jgi:hypothetical protein